MPISFPMWEKLKSPENQAAMSKCEYQLGVWVLWALKYWFVSWVDTKAEESESDGAFLVDGVGAGGKSSGSRRMLSSLY